MRGVVGVLGVLVVGLLGGSAEAATRAGVAVVDATWHAGASGGQFSDDTGPVAEDGTVDPHGHNVKKRRSDGVAIRSTVRALVVKDRQGDRVAVVTTDLYLPNDLLQRRAGSLLEAHDRAVRAGTKRGPVTGVSSANLAMTASHNHNTTFTTTPGWGTAIFQDLMDVRAFAYMARRIADAVIAASRRMVPVRIGGTTRTFDAVQAHTYGPQVADDGTPAGQPFSHTTQRLSVVRLDDVSDRTRPAPLVNWVVFGLHPEFTWGYDLINGDFTHAAARMVDRQAHTTTLFSQRETGTSGPHKDRRVHPPRDRREFEDNGFNGLDRGSRMIADAVLAARRDIEDGTPQHPHLHQPFQEDFDVAAISRRVAPPPTKVVTGISNCNAYALFHGDPRLPVLGFPDCFSVGKETGTQPAFQAAAPITKAVYDEVRKLDLPLPSTYSATALTAVQETNAVHLMAFKLGGVGATFNPSEQFTDTALNTESRLDRVVGNRWDGFDWTALETPSGRDWCVRQGGGATWTCANPKAPATDLAPIDDTTYRRFRAQIHNDATGWETDVATLAGEAEPTDPAKIKGNFTHEEHPRHGFALPLSVGMANDYFGYQPEYREHLSHDHYRKALAALGPHGSDFLATRLSRMAAALNGAPALTAAPLDLAADVESRRAQWTADALGTLGDVATRAYDAAQPRDPGPPAITTEPKDVARFDAAHVSWTGGSTWQEVPAVAVERFADGAWRPYGDGSGDVQVMAGFPKAEQLPDAQAGRFRWGWTAAFEAFASDVAQPDATGTPRRATPAGSYRFRIRGTHRATAGAPPRPYTVTSRTFAVRPWDGLVAEDLRVEPDGTVSLRADPVDYPDSYRSPFRFIEAGEQVLTYGSDDPAEHQAYCRRCTFRPWQDDGAVTAARVQLDGREVDATRQPDGRWRTAQKLPPGKVARVPVGGLRDEHGNVNGEASAAVTR